jgi:hypothetical protein
MVLKLPWTRADSTKGLHRYNGLFGSDIPGDGGIGGGCMPSDGGKVAEVGVGDLFGRRGARPIERLSSKIN